MANRDYDSDEFESESGRGFRGRRDFGNRMTPPVKEGDEIDVTIEAIAAKGDGLAKKEGFVIFVPGTKEGQRVRIRITRVLRRLAFGEVVGATESKEAAEEPKAKESESFGEEAEESKEEESEEEPSDKPSEEEPEEDYAGEDSENF